VTVAAAGPRSLERCADLLAGYDRHVARLPINDGCRYARRRAARRLMARHPDLGAWMTGATPARLLDLHRADAWPFMVWCFVAGHLRPDAELLLAKPGGVELASVWDAAHPGDAARVAQVGQWLGWSANWTRQVCRHTLPVVCLAAGKTLDELTEDDLIRFARDVEQAAHLSASARLHAPKRLFAIWQACWELGITTAPPRRAGRPALSPVEQAEQITQPAIRREVIRYVQTVSTVLRPATVTARTKAIRVFADWLATYHPQVSRLDQLERAAHVEPFLAWARTRPWRGANGRGRTVSLTLFHHDVVDLRVFFEDIAAWGWASQPRRRLLFLTDLPRLPEPMPRALPPEIDRAVMAEVARLDDAFARTGLLLLRATGVRAGELLDLELDCLVDFGAHGTWLRVPVGKLATERMVPLDTDAVGVLDAWMASRGQLRAIPHPRDGHLTDFVFIQRGRRPTKWRLAQGLDRAATAAGLRRPDGSPLHITPHQLRHTYGTSLINAGIALPALMALMGHVTPEMTLRYAKLASPTVRAAYQAAMDKVRLRQPLPLLVGSRALVPDRVAWLAQEMLKTRVAHGYCSRHLTAGACPYANICEQCDNFVPAPEFIPVIEHQLADVHALRADAAQRQWDAEEARHERVIQSLEGHLHQLKKASGPAAPA
jgi:integrase